MIRTSWGRRVQSLLDRVPDVHIIGPIRTGDQTVKRSSVYELAQAFAVLSLVAFPPACEGVNVDTTAGPCDSMVDDECDELPNGHACRCPKRGTCSDGTCVTSE